MKSGGAGPAAAALREARTQDRVGGDRCVICGESEFPALMKTSRTLLEEHHVFGQNHEGETTAPVCRNCHAKLHEDYLREGVDLREQESTLDRLRETLKALAHFLIALGRGLLGIVERTWQEAGA